MHPGINFWRRSLQNIQKYKPIENTLLYGIYFSSECVIRIKFYSKHAIINILTTLIHLTHSHYYCSLNLIKLVFDQTFSTYVQTSTC